VRALSKALHTASIAITDDHAAQEAAFYDAPDWQRSPPALRERLTEREIDAYQHPPVRFVGLAAYEAAGGGTRRDLFAEGEAGVYLTDAALLDRLAQDKLAGITEEVRAEGWAWVEAAPAATYADLQAFQRAPQEKRQPNAREAKRIAKRNGWPQAPAGCPPFLKPPSRATRSRSRQRKSSRAKRPRIPTTGWTRPMR
jgi:ParB-like chromosome segregation protein Spo0J